MPPGPHALYAYQPAWACRTYRGTAGGGCATLLAVLLNDKADPLGFGARRKKVDEVYGFGATPVFHNAEPETPNEYGCGTHGAFPACCHASPATLPPNVHAALGCSLHPGGAPGEKRPVSLPMIREAP